MKKCIYSLALAAFFGGTAGAVQYPFTRYDVILDRKPFGEPPKNVVVKPQPVEAKESFAKYYRLCSIVQDDDGAIRVGIIDTKSKRPFTLLDDGEGVNGVELISADYDNEEVILRKGEEMARLKMGDKTAQAIQQAAEQKVEQNNSRPSYAARRRARIERAQPQPPPEPKFTGDELKKHLQEYNMEAIREGLPPLPIPLTPEQDDQLVKEGVLPPVE